MIAHRLSTIQNAALILVFDQGTIVERGTHEKLLGEGSSEGQLWMYVIVGIVIIAVIFIMHYLQYTVTYMGTYEESERRRITLAEKLRTLPLRFFEERDLSDLTSTIMGDCSGFEHAFSHTVPQFWGSLLSTALVCIALLVYDWRMGLALLWVAPAAFAIVLLSRKLQERQGQKHMAAKLALADGIQECLETVADIKACNQEAQYLKKLDEKMDRAERTQISSELVSASLITTGQMFLRLGLATVIVVGNALVIRQETTLFAYILFLIAASRLYDSLSGKGQITIPINVRNKLKLRAGDKIVILEENGRFYFENSAMLAFKRAEEAFAGEAQRAGFETEADMQEYMKEIRKEVRGR